MLRNTLFVKALRQIDCGTRNERERKWKMSLRDGQAKDYSGFITRGVGCRWSSSDCTDSVVKSEI